MINLTLKINNIDFKWVANKYGYETDLEYIYGKEYVNLNKITRKNLIRTKGILKIDTNFFTQTELTTLFNQLNHGIVSVTYYNHKLSAEVTQDMEVDAEAVRERFKNFKTMGVITFTEL